MEAIENKIISILSQQCGAEEGEIKDSTELFEEGLLDSFGVIQLVMALEDTFSVSLEIGSIPREQITTPHKIAGLIQERLS